MGVTVLASVQPRASEPSRFPHDGALRVPGLYPQLELATPKRLQRHHPFGLRQKANPQQLGKEGSGRRVLPTLTPSTVS